MPPRSLVLLSCICLLAAACSSGGGGKEVPADEGLATADGSGSGDLGPGGRDGGAGTDSSAPGSGIGKPCVGHADCAAQGLLCISKGAGDVDAFCSKVCGGGDGCPAGTDCLLFDDQQVCKPRGFCAACSTSADCGEVAPRCALDDVDQGYCTAECNPSAPACPLGNRCTQTDPGDPRFFCAPISGSCRGDGKQCSPCQLPADCLEGFVCLTSQTTGERFCTSTCTRDQDCPRDHKCAPSAEGSGGICLRDVGAELVATCLAGTGAFCDSCAFGFQCQSGVCLEKPESGVKHCSIPCARQGDPACPAGTFCVTSGASTTGWACTPPSKYKCSGWLNCVGVECKAGQVCEKGWCHDA